MAAKKENSAKVQIEFVLDECHSSAAKSTLVIECIKYLLYERHQIPTTVDQMFRNNEAELSVCQTHHRRTDSKKRIQLLNDLKCLFQNLEELFASTPVCSALLMFGSTAVSPKESYQLNFLSPFNSITSQSPSLSSSESSCRRMSRKFLRNLVMNEDLRDFKEIPSTPLLVFLQVPRTVKNSWFRPKHSFKVPSKGNFCTIILKNGEVAEETNNEQDFVWLQAPVTIKGYCEKMKDVTNVFSEFWE